MLIKLEAIILPMAVPTIVKAAGNVAIYLILIISEAIIPLKRTVTGATVNENICANIMINKFVIIYSKSIFIKF